MFSGLIAHRGTVRTATQLEGGGMRLSISCEGAAQEAAVAKDSIAVNGVCLTATQVDGDLVAFDVVPETLERSSLGGLNAGDDVNIEYSLRLGDRLGGHFVYGHVDETARVLARTQEGQGERMRIELTQRLRPYVCEKAFVAVDGVSVTVATASALWFDLALIPETLARTTLGRRKPGDRVNLEADPIARYARNRTYDDV